MMDYLIKATVQKSNVEKRYTHVCECCIPVNLKVGKSESLTIHSEFVYISFIGHCSRQLRDEHMLKPRKSLNTIATLVQCMSIFFVMSNISKT